MKGATGPNDGRIYSGANDDLQGYPGFMVEEVCRVLCEIKEISPDSVVPVTFMRDKRGKSYRIVGDYNGAPLFVRAENRFMWEMHISDAVKILKVVMPPPKKPGILGRFVDRLTGRNGKWGD